MKIHSVWRIKGAASETYFRKKQSADERQCREPLRRQQRPRCHRVMTRHAELTYTRLMSRPSSGYTEGSAIQPIRSSPRGHMTKLWPRDDPFTVSFDLALESLKCIIPEREWHGNVWERSEERGHGRSVWCHGAGRGSRCFAWRHPLIKMRNSSCFVRCPKYSYEHSFLFHRQQFN